MNSQLLMKLIRKLQKKDLDEHQVNLAFEKLVKIMYEKMYAFSISKCVRSHNTNSIDDVKDLIQESLIKIFVRLNTFKINDDQDDEKSKVQFMSWVFTIINNTWLDRLKEIKRKGAERFDMNKEWRYIYYPFEEKEISENLKKLNAILENTPDDTREIVFTCINFRGGIIPKDIMEDLSESTGKSKENIRQIYSRFKKRLKSELT